MEMKGIVVYAQRYLKMKEKMVKHITNAKKRKKPIIIKIANRNKVLPRHEDTLSPLQHQGQFEPSNSSSMALVPHLKSKSKESTGSG